jgi:hypothetical protein
MINTKTTPLSIKFLDKEPELYERKLREYRRGQNKLICRWIPTGKDYPKMTAIWVTAPPDD